MIIYLLSCESVHGGGGVYAVELTESGKAQKCGYFPCDRPMYAVKCKKGLCVLLRRPTENSEDSGYFFASEDLKDSTEIRSTLGAVACHLCADGDDIYIANYISGNIVKNGKTVAKRTGHGPNPDRQREPHTHFISKTPDGYFAVCDLGTDTLAIYDSDLRLISESKVPSGYGIRHAAFSADGKYIYAVNELVPSVSTFVYRGGKAALANTVKIDCEKKNASGAAIRLSQDGKTLFVSVREENIICAFDVKGEVVKPIYKFDCGGDCPRDLDIYGNFLVIRNEKSGNAMVYDIKNKKYTDEIKLEKQDLSADGERNPAKSHSPSAVEN